MKRVRTRSALHYQGALNEKQAARYISYSVITLRNWRSEGRGPVYLKIDGWTVRYLRDDLDDWLKSQIRVKPIH